MNIHQQQYTNKKSITQKKKSRTYSSIENTEHTQFGNQENAADNSNPSWPFASHHGCNQSAFYRSTAFDIFTTSTLRKT